jgi:hypothetical protein
MYCPGEFVWDFDWLLCLSLLSQLAVEKLLCFKKFTCEAYDPMIPNLYYDPMKLTCEVYDPLKSIRIIQAISAPGNRY